MPNPHYIDRARTIAEIARSEGLTKDSGVLYNALCNKAKRAAKSFSCGNVAVGIHRFPKVIGSYNRNGDIVFAIIRSGAITTVQLRRSNQVNSADRLRVDYVAMEV